jgi:UDP-galactopyranose mutase
LSRFSADYVIVGAGLTGATIARALSSAGRDVVVVERREEVAGNVRDTTHPSGIRMHLYGPHYFRTNSDLLWSYVTSFSDFTPYEAVVMTLVDGQEEYWPVTQEYIGRTVGAEWSTSFKGTPNNFEEACLAMMPEPVYHKFVKGYSEKQWGVPAAQLDASLAGRFQVRSDQDRRLMSHKYQGIPSGGYTAWVRSMLVGIPTVLGIDYLRSREDIRANKMLIFSGPIDEYFGFDLGRLKYRGQQRSHEYLADSDLVLQCGQVNNPDPDKGPHIRTLEWKHMMPHEHASRIRGTLLTRETTVTPDNPEAFEYPFPDQANRILYERYRSRGDALTGTLICGRLGEYRYYDMDQAIARALSLAAELLGLDSWKDVPGLGSG